MKKTLIHLFSCALLSLLTLESYAQQTDRFKLFGTISNEHGEGVGYATTMLRSKTDSSKIYIVVSDEAGKFEIDAPQRSYEFKIYSLGYEDHIQEIFLTQNQDLGTILLKENAVEVDSVVVKGGKFISRETDRFVVNVANTPLAVGKSAKEMLEISPGVWVDEKSGISINGKAGTKVMLNNRLLRESGEELINYLNNLNAEDILKIEIIPNVGADEDADMRGGLIKITSKKQRENGIDGSVGMRYNSSLEDNNYLASPNVTLNYKQNKLSGYVNGSLSYRNDSGEAKSTTKFLTNNLESLEQLDWRDSKRNGTIRSGSVYDFNPKQSAGVELSYSENSFHDKSNLKDIRSVADSQIVVTSRDLRIGTYNRLSLSGNYIYKFGDKGSQLKVLLDYTRRSSDDNKDMKREFRGAYDRDSMSRYIIHGANNLYAATANFDWVLNQISKLKLGSRYTFSGMDNDIQFWHLRDQAWQPINSLTRSDLFDEHISALYGDYSITFPGNISLSAGIRGEHTYAIPKTSNIVIRDKQNRFDLFPSMNLSLPLNKKMSHTLILNYSRNIQRPGFWQLNPFRTPESEFEFREGNPRLKPAFQSDYSLCWVISQKYSITTGVTDTRDIIQNVAYTLEGDDSGILIRQPRNIARKQSYYLALNLPIKVSSWWQINSNINASYNRMDILGTQQHINTLQGNLANVFTLSKIFNFNLSGNYEGPYYWGYSKYSGFFSINTSLVGKFINNKITSSIYVNNLLHSPGDRYTSIQPELMVSGKTTQPFTRVGISFRYNFKAGKEFKARKVESGSSDSESRMGGGM